MLDGSLLIGWLSSQTMKRKIAMMKSLKWAVPPKVSSAHSHCCLMLMLIQGKQPRAKYQSFAHHLNPGCEKHTLAPSVIIPTLAHRSRNTFLLPESGIGVAKPRPSALIQGATRWSSSVQSSQTQHFKRNATWRSDGKNYGKKSARMQDMEMQSSLSRSSNLYMYVCTKGIPDHIHST